MVECAAEFPLSRWIRIADSQWSPYPSYGRSDSIHCDAGSRNRPECLRPILDENVRVESGARIGYGDSEHAISLIPANSLITANQRNTQNATSPLSQCSLEERMPARQSAASKSGY